MFINPSVYINYPLQIVNNVDKVDKKFRNGWN